MEKMLTLEINYRSFLTHPPIHLYQSCNYLSLKKDNIVTLYQKTDKYDTITNLTDHTAEKIK